MAERTPIVFFPGVMGSRLFFPSANKFWDPDSTYQMLFWAPYVLRSDDDNRRELHFRQPARVVVDPSDRREMDELGVRLGWGGVAWTFYSQFLRDLRDVAFNSLAYAVGYDWRQDLRWLGAYAARKLNLALDQTGAAKLTVVTHSMGGLVLRAALRHDPELIPHIGKFISICQPASGAVVLYRRMFTGMASGDDGSLGFRILLGKSRRAFVGNMSGLPGPMQLLPSEHFPNDDAGRPWHSSINGILGHNDLYPSAISPPGLLDAALGLSTAVRDDLRGRIGELAEAHAWLGGAISDGFEPRTYSILGVDRRTEVRIAFQGADADPVFDDHGGDGTVPMLSARSLPTPDSQRFLISDVEHGMACQHPDVRQTVRDLLASA